MYLFPNVDRYVVHCLYSDPLTQEYAPSFSNKNEGIERERERERESQLQTNKVNGEKGIEKAKQT